MIVNQFVQFFLDFPEVTDDDYDEDGDNNDNDEEETGTFNTHGKTLMEQTPCCLL